MQRSAAQLFKESIFRAFRRFDKDDICVTPQNPDYTGFNSTYAFEPRGFRISKVVDCSRGLSIRLINFKSWLTPHDEQGDIRLNCHEVLTIALDLARAIEVGTDRYSRKQTWMRTQLFDATYYIPREQLDSELYRIGASSW